MGASVPVVYLLQGDDELGIANFIQDMHARLGEPGMADLNTSRLDGGSISLEELESACLSLPVFTERRLVVLTNPRARLASKEAQEKFVRLLESLPQSTALVLVEYSLPNKRNQTKDWLRKWAQEAKDLAFVRDFPSPKGAQMVKWIQEKAEQRGGRFAPQAATLLASLVGEDTRLADQEINKLLDYVDFARPVDAEDVNELCPYVGILGDFALVNAIRERDGRQALGILKRELEKKEPLFLFQSIVTLFRELLMTRDVLDRGGGQPEIVRELRDLNVSSGRAYHLLRQANGFTTPELISIYHRLLEVDEAIKTSQMSAEAVLEIFLASFTLQQPTHR